MKHEIKAIVADILYLDSVDAIKDDDKLFTELGLSSIDYIDLGYEIKQKINNNIGQDELWPINKLVLDEAKYKNGEWTESGWDEVRELLNISETTEKLPLNKLYDYFTVNYICKRVQDLS